MQAHLITNKLFSTTEYKLVSANSLEVTELSASGAYVSKTFSLNSVNIEEGTVTPIFLPWLVFFLGSIVVALIGFLSQSFSLLHDNLFSTVSFLICAFATLAFICKPVKSHIYRDTFSNKILFKLSNLSENNSISAQFIDTLNASIKEAKTVESQPIDLTPNAQLQYDTHNKNVENLYNLGLIDEALYNRICHSMYEKVFGEIETLQDASNVIYLNR